MSPNTNNTQEELLKLQTSAENTHNKNSHLIVREEIPNTPFVMVGNDTVGYMLTLGQYNLTEFQPSMSDVVEHWEKNKWIIIERMIGAMIHFNENNPITDILKTDLRQIK